MPGFVARMAVSRRATVASEARGACAVGSAVGGGGRWSSPGSDVGSEVAEAVGVALSLGASGEGNGMGSLGSAAVCAGSGSVRGASGRNSPSEVNLRRSLMTNGVLSGMRVWVLFDGQV